MSIAFCQPFQKADLVALGSDLTTVHGAIQVSIYWTGQTAGVVPGKYDIPFDHECDIYHVGIMVQGLLLYILPGILGSALHMKANDTIHIHIPGRAPGQQYTVGELIEDLKKFPLGYKVTYCHSPDEVQPLKNVGLVAVYNEVNLW